ncbi:MAG: CNNM domain-containing protein [Oscillospiraceae bacterium]
MQVAITLGFLGSAFAADNSRAPRRLGRRPRPQGQPRRCRHRRRRPHHADTLYLTLIFGELVPKRLAMKNARRLRDAPCALSGLVSFISVAFKPIVSLLTVSTNGMLRLLRVDPDEDEDVYSEEEIRMMATAGSQKGTIGAEENEFIQNLFEFDDLRAEDFATHRTR